MSRVSFCGWLLLAAMGLSGCTQSKEPASVAAAPDAAYLLTDKPADAQDVEQALSGSEHDEAVAVAGRIGGSEKPFVDGIAAFTIVDPKLHWCADDEGCPTPWDYCCADKAGKVATVKVVGQDGQPVATDARELLGVKELSLVVVTGKAQRDEQGNLTVLAEKVHVSP